MQHLHLNICVVRRSSKIGLQFRRLAGQLRVVVVVDPATPEAFEVVTAFPVEPNVPSKRGPNKPFLPRVPVTPGPFEMVLRSKKDPVPWKRPPKRPPAGCSSSSFLPAAATGGAREHSCTAMQARTRTRMEFLAMAAIETSNCNMWRE